MKITMKSLTKMRFNENFHFFCSGSKSNRVYIQYKPPRFRNGDGVVNKDYIYKPIDYIPPNK